ncbi:hypothetical protein Tco_1303931 [Tanacetum coccineum]
MDTTKDQKIALDDALIAPANRLRIRKCNHRISSSLKSNEPTIQVVLDSLKLTPFDKAFEVTANAPRCLSGKTIGLDSLCLSRAQIIWGMYHKKNVDYVYLLWKDLNHTSSTTLSYLEQNLQSKKTKYKKKADEPVTLSMPKSAPKVKGKRLKTPSKISWKSSDEDDDDEVCISKDNDDNDKNADDANQHTESDIDGDDFVHLRFSTHDEEVRQDEEDKEEEGSDLRVQITSHYESTDDEVSDEVTQGRDTKITNDLQPNVQATKVIEDTHVIITTITLEVQQQSSSVSSGFISNMINPNPNTGIDFILNLNTESTLLVDVPVMTNAEMPPSSVTTLPPPPISFIQPLQQTPVPTPIMVPSTSLQNLPTFSSVFKFIVEYKKLEKKTSQNSAGQTHLLKSSYIIPGIVDKYLANQMNEAVKAVVQLQSDRLREAAQAEKQDFINKIDENIKKIIKEQVKVQVKEQVSMILPRIKKSLNEQLEA